MGVYATKSSANDSLNLELLSQGAKNGVSAEVLATMEARIARLENPASASSAPIPASGIDNLFINSDHDHSVLSFTGAGATDEDYRWFRGCDAAMPVKDAVTNPLWNKSEGWLEWEISSNTDDLSYNFDKRLLRPGQTYYLQFNARIKDGLSAAGLELEAGFWDKTGGIDNWISASLSGGAGSSTIGVAKIGPGAAATNYTYVVVANTDRKETIVSLPATILGAAALNSTDYNQITWTQAGGVLSYRIYRTSPNPGLIGVVSSGSTSFNDTGVLLQANAPIPNPVASQAKVKISLVTAGLSTNWVTIRLSIYIPRNYNFSLTGSDKQWFRMGLRGTSVNTLLIDRMGLSLTPGVWSPSPQDRLSDSDTVITSTNDGQQGGVGTDFGHTGGWWDFAKLSEQVNGT